MKKAKMIIAVRSVETAIQYPAAREMTPNTASSHGAFGSRSPACFPASISTGLAFTTCHIL